MLASFVQEAHSYLHKSVASLETFQRDATQREVLEEALRYTHTIRAPRSWLGLPVLSHMALAEDLEEMVTGQRAMDTACSTWLQQTMDQLEHYLDDSLRRYAAAGTCRCGGAVFRRSRTYPKP